MHRMKIAIDRGTVPAQEQRRHSRIDFREAVQFRFKDSADEHGCLSHDLGEGGVRLAINDFVPLGTEMILRISLTTEKIVDDVARVVWIRKLSTADRYELGLEFLDDAKAGEPKRQIQQWISRHQVT